MALHEVAAHEAAEPQGALEVDAGARPEVAESGDGDRLRTQVEREVFALAHDHGQADAVDGHARPERAALEHGARGDNQPAGLAVEHAPHLLDDAREQLGGSSVPGHRALQ